MTADSKSRVDPPIVASPSGVVTLLFTDIEGSTPRWNAYRDAMRDALRRHDSIVATAIRDRDGRVFKTVGDAFCATFPTPLEALQAAAETQRLLAAQDWSAVGGLPVRMAVHAGECDSRDGDYFGPAVNRVARLLAAAHGGQILVSGDAADAVAGSLPPAMALRNLGTVPLRGFAACERVFQLVAAGLPNDFKPLHEVETPPNNLPRQTTSFVGRDDDVRRVVKLLHDERIVTIAGIGGVGKTRLAVEVGNELLNDIRDGVWFVDLASISDGALVGATMLGAMHAEAAAGATPLDALRAHLAKREALLILDNCEHLVDDVARVVSAVVARCPSVSILATSREVLDVPGEAVYRLPALSTASAVALFAERATAGNPAFRAADHAASIEAICARLDGIALAIELAAARVRAIAPEALLAHLELRALAGGRSREARHQTMRAMIDWSYDLLAPAERAVFRRLAVFAGGFTLEAAAALCAGAEFDEWGVVESVASLVDKSLVVLETNGGRRYRLLETIREYARERLDEHAETQPVARRHAEVFAAVARRGYEEWDTGSQPDWLARLGRELDNVRAALAWTIEERNDVTLGAHIAADILPVLMRRSFLAEAIDWGTRALSFAETLSDSTQARLRYGLSMVYNNRGDAASAYAAILPAIPLYREANDVRGLTRALSQAARQHADRGELAEAKAAAEEALQLARELGDRRLLASVLQRSAFSYEPGEIDQIRARYAEAVTLFRAVGRDDETARALAWWAQAESELGQFDAAIRISLQALELADDEITMHLKTDLASLYIFCGDLTDGEPMAREGLELAAKADHPIAFALSALYLAAIGSERDVRGAAALFGFADARFRAIGWQPVGCDKSIFERVRASLERQIPHGELVHLVGEGAHYGEDRAAALARRL